MTMRRRFFSSSGFAAKSLFTRSAMVFFLVAVAPETVVASARVTASSTLW